MAVVEAGRTGSMHVVTSDTAEGEEEEAGTMTDLVVYLQGNGEEARHHQIESQVLVEEEAEGIAVTGGDEGGRGGSCTNAWAIWPALFDGFDPGTLDRRHMMPARFGVPLLCTLQTASRRYYRCIVYSYQRLIVGLCRDFANHQGVFSGLPYHYGVQFKLRLVICVRAWL
jgi:hypothetical protein